MRIRCRVDVCQETRFVIDESEALFRLVDGDLVLVHRRPEHSADRPADAVLATDRVYTPGGSSYHGPWPGRSTRNAA